MRGQPCRRVGGEEERNAESAQSELAFVAPGEDVIVREERPAGEGQGDRERALSGALRPDDENSGDVRVGRHRGGVKVETPFAPREGPVLDVSVKDGLVSIRARKQMVTAILLDVASKAGMGFETRGQLDEAFIDLDVRGLPVDQLPATMARPNFAVLMRRNLTAASTRPVAVLLGSEATRVKK